MAPEAPTLSEMTIATLCLEVCRAAQLRCGISGDLDARVVTCALTTRPSQLTSVPPSDQRHYFVENQRLTAHCGFTAQRLFCELATSEEGSGVVASLASHVLTAAESQQRLIFHVKYYNHEFIIVIRDGIVEILQSFWLKYSLGELLKSYTTAWSPEVLREYLYKITWPDVQEELFFQRLNPDDREVYIYGPLKTDTEIWKILFDEAVTNLNGCRSLLESGRANTNQTVHHKEGGKVSKDLFEQVVPDDKLHPAFARLQNHPASVATRAALSAAYDSFADPDGNFLKDFQSVGFDARLFELYLSAYFSYSGFSLDRSHNRPDFLVSRNGLTIAVEATTSNPSQSGILATGGTPIADLHSEAEILKYVDGELAVRQSGPLNTKLKASYWKEPHVDKKPIVFAIQAFHDPQSLYFSDSSLAQYLYGLKGTPRFDEDGTVRMDSAPIDKHSILTKEVPSGFFALPDSDYISAVIFTNAGSHAKFTRMGYQMGAGTEVLHIVRHGLAYDPEPSAMLPAYFSYNLDAPPRVEPWGEGLIVLHNPFARHPIPDGFFPFASDTRLVSGEIVSRRQWWHPITSTTRTNFDPNKKLLVERPHLIPVDIVSISKKAFHDITQAPELPNELAWFCDVSDSFVGAVVGVPDHSHWSYAIFARDMNFRFHMILLKSGHVTAADAGVYAQHAIEKLLRRPKRIFAHGLIESVFDDDDDDGSANGDRDESADGDDDDSATSDADAELEESK